GRPASRGSAEKNGSVHGRRRGWVGNSFGKGRALQLDGYRGRAARDGVAVRHREDRGDVAAYFHFLRTGFRALDCEYVCYSVGHVAEGSCVVWRMVGVESDPSDDRQYPRGGRIYGPRSVCHARHQAGGGAYRRCGSRIGGRAMMSRAALVVLLAATSL